EVEAEPRVVEEQEVADDAQLEDALSFEEPAHDAVRLVERLLNGGVLERVDAQRLGGGIECDDERTAHRLEQAVALDQAGRRAAAHADSCRSAFWTALRIIVLDSSAARPSAARAAGEPTRPRAMAAH